MKKEQVANIDERMAKSERRKAAPKHVRLCGHVKDDGKLCGSPAVRKRRYCRYHGELRQRRYRMARAQYIARLNEEARANRARMGDLIYNSPILKRMIAKFFGDNILADKAELNSLVAMFCGKEGEGGRGSRQ